MAKSKKSDLEKVPKDKGSKALKGEKPGKDKKDKKKDKKAEAVLTAEVKPPKLAVKAPSLKKAAPVSITDDDISLRAYFIAERRQAMGWPGDSSSDWVEAERQLKAEATKKSKS